MTERKPPGEKIEAWVERQTREATDAGTFENLPGAGKPIPDLDRPYDPNWWAKERLRREGVSMLPDALRLRVDVQKEMARISDLETEDEVREAIATLNAHIRATNASITAGPPSNVVPLDVERVVVEWRRARASDG